MKNIYALLLIIAVASSSFGINFPDEETPGAMAPDAMQKALDYVNSKKWQTGRNNDGSYIAIGQAGIDGREGTENWEKQRVNAYSKAMLDAKAKMAEFFAAKIQQSMESSYTEGNFGKNEEEDNVTKQEKGLFEKVNLLLNAKLDTQLEKEGISLEDPNKQEEIQEIKLNILATESFKSEIAKVAESEICGLMVSKVFLDNGDLVVVCRQSDKVMQLAAAMAQNAPAPKVKPRTGTTISEWINGFKIKDLYPLVGVQLRSDENGDIAIISFGQSCTTSASKTMLRASRNKADLSADGFIRQFAGEAVTVAKSVAATESKDVLSGDDIQIQIEESSSEKIASVSKSLELPGISTVRQWNFTDSESGLTYVGVVKRWTITSAQGAVETRQKNASAATSESKNWKASSSSKAYTSNSGQTIKAGDNSSQSYESIESEDF